MEQELSNILQLSESVVEIVFDVFIRYFPLLSLPLAIGFVFRMVSLVIGTAGYSTSSSDPVYTQKLTKEEVEIIEQELLTLEEPEPTHREESAATAPDPTPVHIKMVKCKHCLAPKPKDGTCAYCGLG